MTDITRSSLQNEISALSKINDPFLGVVDPAEFQRNSMLWPGEKWAVVEAFESTAQDQRKVEEFRFFKQKNDGEFLPVTFFFETLNNGERVGYVYSDHHLVDDRAPIHAPDPDLTPWQNEQDVLYPYFMALKENRIEDVLLSFRTDGYFQHSNGETFNGREEMRVDFEKMLGDDGIQIKYCRVTDDGKTCVIECYMPTGRPALAIYERAGDQIKAVRICL